MPTLQPNLILSRCPHCRVDNPNLVLLNRQTTTAFDETNPRWWGIYQCKRCGGLVTVAARATNGEVTEIYPSPLSIDTCIPTKAKAFLEQAVNSYHAPSGAIMLAASAVDAMLKSKGFTQGNLYPRIKKAREEHVITEGMELWAHQVRLDANDERHADEDAPLPTSEDAKRTVEFALALAEFLFVLPERVTRGLTQTKPQNSSPTQV